MSAERVLRRKSNGLRCTLVSTAMAFMRSNTAHSLESKAWSCQELMQGIGFVMTDGKNELPDDLAQLQDWVALGRCLSERLLYGVVQSRVCGRRPWKSG